MKKILMAFDGIQFSESAFEFAIKLNEVSPILLTGVFLPQAVYANFWSYAGGDISGTSYIPLLEDFDTEEINKNIETFEKMCQKNGIEYRVHKDFYDFAIPDLKKETRYADLMLIGSQSFFENLGASQSHEYLKDALNATECPVIVIPEKITFPKNNVLAYDGTADSVFAIKQFAYLFPELAKNKTLLVYADKNADKKIPEEQNIEELAARHFPDLTVMKLEINPKKYFSTWLGANESAILISGSFGGSIFSQMFKKSFAAEVISDHKLPVFITHT